MEVDPNTLSDDDLEKALALGDDFVPPPPAEPEPVVEPPPADEPEPVAESAEPPPAPEPTPEEMEAERLRLLSEELEARAKHWESVAGRNAGELGFIKSQLRAIQAAQAQALQARDTMDETGEQTPPPAPLPPQNDGLAQWAVQQAVQQAVGSFEASHPEVKDLGEKMAEYLKTSGYDMGGVMKMANPIEAQREISRVLEEAFWHTKAAVTSARRAELSAKREAVQLKAAESKLKSSVSGTASTPPPKPKAKTQEEMTDAELEAEMVRVMGGRW